MATISTDNFYLPQNGDWLQLYPTGTYNFLDIRSFPCNHGFYVFIGDAAPDNAQRGPVGIKVDDTCLFINQPFTPGAGIYARCLTPDYGGSDPHDARLRLDVTIIKTA